MLEKQVIIQGSNIRYLQSDSLDKERSVVFLHGWGSQALHLKSILEIVPNFVALDLPGFGGSDLPPVPWGVAEYAWFLENFLAKLEIRKPILVGHSVGGSIIIKYLSGVGTAKKAILISSSGIRKKGLKIFLYKIVTKIFKFIFSLPGLNIFKDRIRKRFYSAIDSKDYIEAGKMVESYKKIIRDDLTGVLPDIAAPVVLIWGEKDSITPLWQGELMQKKIVRSKLFVIADAGHYSFIDQPEKFKEIFSKEI